MYQIQDLGDGEGLDVLKDGGDRGDDAVAFGRSVAEVVEILEDMDVDAEGSRVLVLAGALGREADEEVDVDDLVDELQGLA